MCGLGTASKANTSLFVLRRPNITMFMLIYVDDIVVVSSTSLVVDRLIPQLHSNFALKELGPLYNFLGIEVIKSHRRIVLSQYNYISHLLIHANMVKCNAAAHLDRRSTKYLRLLASLFQLGTILSTML